MPADAPLACTLAPAAQPARLARIEALGRAALRAADTGPRTAILRFDAAPAHERELAAIVAAESACCAFLEFAQARSGDALELRIDAPPGGEETLALLVAAFRDAPPPS